MYKAVEHFKTITRHRHEVIKNCFRAGIPIQGLFHDLSKYSSAEFIVSCKYYQGVRSPNEAEREVKGYSTAWMHHKGRNRHHFEYWTDYNPKTRRMSGVKMPINYVVEMFCDRVAASKIYMGDNYSDKAPLEYFLKGNAKFTLHPKTARLIEHMLRMLAEKGEEYTFAYLRHIVSRNR